MRRVYVFFQAGTASGSDLLSGSLLISTGRKEKVRNYRVGVILIDFPFLASCLDHVPSVYGPALIAFSQMDSRTRKV